MTPKDYTDWITTILENKLKRQVYGTLIERQKKIASETNNEMDIETLSELIRVVENLNEEFRTIMNEE